MIIDLGRFIRRERPRWEELDAVIEKLEAEPVWKLEVDQAKRLHYLYERAAAGLVRISTFSSDPDVTRYLESLVGRAYAMIHSLDRPRRRFAPIHWFFVTFPRTFRAHIRAFVFAAAVTLAGMAFGGFAVAFDPQAKSVILPFRHLLQDPERRVETEEQRTGDRLEGRKGVFAAFLMTHNIRVAITAMALGITWGIGTIVLLFYNGVVLGAVIIDYVLAGEAGFLVGWLLPHGAVEIPAILLAGQTGVVLGSAVIGRGDRNPLKIRLRESLPTLVTLIFAVAILLIWAALIEAFFSQYHEPLIPYALKIALGVTELAVLGVFLGISGRRDRYPKASRDEQSQS